MQKTDTIKQHENLIINNLITILIKTLQQMHNFTTLHNNINQNSTTKSIQTLHNLQKNAYTTTPDSSEIYNIFTTTQIKNISKSIQKQTSKQKIYMGLYKKEPSKVEEYIYLKS